MKLLSWQRPDNALLAGSKVFAGGASSCAAWDAAPSPLQLSLSQALLAPRPQLTVHLICIIEGRAHLRQEQRLLRLIRHVIVAIHALVPAAPLRLLAWVLLTIELMLELLRVLLLHAALLLIIC